VTPAEFAIIGRVSDAGVKQLTESNWSHPDETSIAWATIDPSGVRRQLDGNDLAREFLAVQLYAGSSTKKSRSISRIRVTRSHTLARFKAAATPCRGVS
jgi:hypothetical protein